MCHEIYIQKKWVVIKLCVCVCGHRTVSLFYLTLTLLNFQWSINNKPPVNFPKQAVLNKCTDLMRRYVTNGASLEILSLSS